MYTPINHDLLQSFKQSIVNDTTIGPIQRAVTSNGINQASTKFSSSATNTTVFSNEIETSGITDQDESGRCWLFATLNILRHEIAKTYKLEDFELSQSYSFFWDKLEKSNIFYEHILETATLPYTDRKIDHLLYDPQYDGGWWEMSAAVIQKYGVVPKHVMPETIATSNTTHLNRVLNRKLRKDALLLREKALTDSKEEVQQIKQNMLNEVYRILTIAIGTPPESFDFVYKDKDKKYHRDNGLTPLGFLKKYSKLDFNNYVSIANVPTPSKKFLQPYTLEWSENVAGQSGFTYLNVDIETFKDLAVKQIKAGEPIWFGCDISASSTKKGYLALDVYDYSGMFGVDIALNKADSLVGRDSSANHAVVLSAVDIVNDTPRQWKIENSWGDDIGHKGYYTMTTEWMEQNGYVIVIRKDLLGDTLTEALKKEPIVLPVWD